MSIEILASLNVQSLFTFPTNINHHEEDIVLLKVHLHINKNENKVLITGRKQFAVL